MAHCFKFVIYAVKPGYRISPSDLDIIQLCEGVLLYLVSNSNLKVSTPICHHVLDTLC